jgi:hypothetical protein
MLPFRDLAEGLDTLFSRAALSRLEGWLAWQNQDMAGALQAWEDARDRSAEAGLDVWYVEAVLAMAQLPGATNTGGLATWQRLQELVGGMGAPAWSAVVSAGAAQAYRAAGEPLLADRLSRHAHGLVSELQAGLPGTTLRAQFFAHPQRLPWLKTLESEPGEEGVPFGRRLAMLLELARVLGNSREPEAVLQLVHAHTLELTRAERCLVLLLKLEGAGWQVWPEADDVPYSHSLVQQVLESHVPLCVVDTLQPGGWQPAQSVRDLHLRSVVAVPIASGTTVHGVLYVDSRVAMGAFGADDVSMLEAIASQAAVALETTRL